jgi:hypothetical protein
MGLEIVLLILLIIINDLSFYKQMSHVWLEILLQTLLFKVLQKIYECSSLNVFLIGVPHNFDTLKDVRDSTFNRREVWPFSLYEPLLKVLQLLQDGNVISHNPFHLESFI